MPEPDPLEGLSDVDIGVRFAAMIVGADGVDEGPPDPDTPLGRVLSLTAALKKPGVPDAAVSAAVRAMWGEEWRAMGLLD